MSSVRQEDVDDGDEQRQGKARMGVKQADSGQRLIQCSSCFKKVYISVKYNTHFKCPPNNIHQGESEGKNLYQCKECGNSMCLVCSVVDVTISHFYGQVARYEIGTMFFWYTCSHVREGIQQTPGRAPCMVRCLSLLLELEFLIDQSSCARWQ